MVTTQNDPKRQPPPNLLNRELSQDQPNKVWAGNITYLPTREGWLYLLDDVSPVEYERGYRDEKVKMGLMAEHCLLLSSRRPLLPSFLR